MKKIEMVEIEGKKYEWDTIVSYMDDNKREKVHCELAPCTNEQFFKRYCRLDRKFYDFVVNTLSSYAMIEED